MDIDPIVVSPIAGDSAMAGHPGQTRERTGTAATARGPAVVEAALRAAVSERLGEARFGLWFGDGVRLGSAATAMRWKSGCPTPSSATGSAATTPTACSRRPRRWWAGRCGCRSRSATRPSRRWATWSSPGRIPSEPDSEPPRRRVITVPMPGNPKTPLSFPARRRAVPGLRPGRAAPACRRSDQPHPPNRMQAHVRRPAPHPRPVASPRAGRRGGSRIS